ncbi:MFS transporter [Bacillus marinisedimentorum]|uniref:MFS transporter n=1 Tax=Bacillus marinisedimentorum TaxID=1821260 RepID=UPI000AB45DB0
MNKSFYALLVSQTSTNLGFALYTMAVVLHLFNETGSTALSAAVTLVSVISRMVSHVVLPSISDRYKLRDILKLSQLLQVVLLIGMFFLLLQKLTGVMTTAVFILLSLISFFNGFFVPIKSSLVKVVIPAKLRVKANSLISTVDQTFLFAGWTFGGVILAFLGIPLTLIITIFFLAISVFSLLLFKTNSSPDIKETAGMMERLTIGWKYLFKHKGLRILIMMDLMEAWVGTIWIGAVTLTYAEQALGKGEAWWGYINGGYYFGTIAGGILIYRLSKVMQGRLAGYMLVGSFIFGILTFLYGFIFKPLCCFIIGYPDGAVLSTEGSCPGNNVSKQHR